MPMGNQGRLRHRDGIDFDLYTEVITDRDYDGHIVAMIRRDIERDTKRKEKKGAKAERFV